MSLSRQKTILFSVALVMIAGTAGALTWLKSHQRLGQPGIKAAAIPGSVTMKIELPEAVPGFVSSNVPTPQVVLDYLPKDTSYAQRYYQAPDGFETMANIILMGADRTSIHRPEYCMPGQGWQIGDKREVKLQIGGEHPYELPVMKWIVSNSYKDAKGQDQKVSGLYVFWFTTEGKTANDFPAMLRSMLFHLLGSGVQERWAYVSYFVLCPPGQEAAAFERLKPLIEKSVPEFQLPPAHASR